jgi:hypothetical protein
MANRTIQSPGVEIRESDLSLRTVSQGTTTYMAGFANEGPTDEVVGVANITEFEQIYGQPRTPAERYFYHSARAALNSTGKLMVNRLPYGENAGVGFGSRISVLAYPASGYDRTDTNLEIRNVAGNIGTTVATGFGAAQLASTLTISNAVLSADETQGNNNQFDLYGGTFTATNANGSTQTVTITGHNILTASNFDVLSASEVTTDLNLGISIGSPLDTYPTPTGTIAISLTGATPRLALVASNTSFAGVGTKLSAFGGVEIFETDYSKQESTWFLGAPTQFDITPEQYIDLTNGELFAEGWSSTAIRSKDITSIQRLSAAAVIVINKAQSSIDGQFNGYYVGLADNTNINPASAFDAIQDVQTTTAAAPSTGRTTFTAIPSARFEFNVSAAKGSNIENSISQVMENSITNYDISTREFDDTLNVGVFKLRQSVFSKDANKMDYLLEEGYNGSIGYYRQINSENGGAPMNFSLGTVEENSRNIEMLVNPHLSDQLTGLNISNDGNPNKKIRVYTNSLKTAYDSGDLAETVVGAPASFLSDLGDKADSLFPLGAYGETNLSTKLAGNIPQKLDRALDRIRNDRKFNIDIIAEAGLGTIFTYNNTATAGLAALGFDDLRTTAKIEELRTSSDLPSSDARDAYTTIFNKFATFAGPTKDGGRGDILFIADPIRQILVTGKDNKVQADKTKNFSTDIYWPLRHQFQNANTSYAATYANYMKVYDNYSGLYTYVPSSGFAAAKMASGDAAVGPWAAPAGFNRGVITDAVDIAFSPNQRQRDDLYTVNLNPIASFSDQGNVFFGQKTLLKKPSAFDRINVRRTFLYLEKITKATMNFFLFENNTLFTRTRVLNTLTPFFERTKNADGLYDYLIVCDERNNTPEVLDQNELVVDIYLKPVKTAEFILVNFYATRTDTNFEELVGG